MFRWFKKKSKQLSEVKFSKKIIVFCIFFIVLYTSIQTYFNSVFGIEVSPTLTTCVYAFFGTELVASAFIRVLDREDMKYMKDMEKKENENKDKQDETPVG